MVVGLVPSGRGSRARSASRTSPSCRCTCGRAPASATCRRSPRSSASMTVEDNLLRDLRDPRALAAPSASERSEELLEEFGLEKLRGAPRLHALGRRAAPRRDRPGPGLSPDFLLLDEPFAGIDPIAVLDIQEIMRQLASSGIGVLITDHNVRETLKITRPGLYHQQRRDPALGHASATLERRRSPKDLPRREFPALTRAAVVYGPRTKAHPKLSQKLVMTPSLQQAIKLLQMTRLELAGGPHPGAGREPGARGAGGGPGDAEAAAERRGRPRTPSRRPTATEPTAEKERDSFEEIDFDAYFEDYLDSAYNPRAVPGRARGVSAREHLTRRGPLRPPALAALMADATPRVREIAELHRRQPRRRRLPGRTEEEMAARRHRRPTRTSTRRSTLVQSLRSAGRRRVATCAECLLRQLERGDRRTRSSRRSSATTGTFLEPPVPGRSRRPRRRHARSEAASSSSAPRARSRAASSRPSARSTSSPTSSCSRSATSTSSSSTTTACRGSASRRRYRRMLQSGNGAIGKARPRNFIKDKMRSAIWLIKSLDQRQRTIYKVAESIVRQQRDFLDHGIEHLRPMVLRDVAEDIGMHESTVSPRGLEQVHPHAARPLPDEVLLPQRHRPRLRRRHLVAHGEAQDPASCRARTRGGPSRDAS